MRQYGIRERARRYGGGRTVMTWAKAISSPPWPVGQRRTQERKTVHTSVPQRRYGLLIFFQNVPPVLISIAIKAVRRERESIPSTNKTIYRTVCTTACTTEITATWRWNILNLAKFQPVAQRKMLFRPAKIQRRGRLAKERTPVRSATYRRYCLYTEGQLEGQQGQAQRGCLTYYRLPSKVG